jgi:hypothetical protein
MQLLLVKQKNGSTGATRRGNVGACSGVICHGYVAGAWRPLRGRAPWRRRGCIEVVRRSDEGAKAGSRPEVTRGCAMWSRRRQNGVAPVARWWVQHGVVVTWRVHQGRALS